MKDSKYIIRTNHAIADKTWKMVLEGDTSSILRGGQFVDIEIDGQYLRRPLAVQCWDGESLTVIYKVVGEGTGKLSGIKEGDSLNVLTGLGNGFNAQECKSKALVVCGGLGASPAFSLVKTLLQQKKAVTVILGFNTGAEVILKQDYMDLGARVQVVTIDGSEGMKGLVTDAIKEVNPEYDYFYTCGPKVMMRAVCEMLGSRGEASLEERMGCGCGICYGCTCHTKSGAKRICADGPVFKKEEIIW